MKINYIKSNGAFIELEVEFPSYLKEALQIAQADKPTYGYTPYVIYDAKKRKIDLVELGNVEDNRIKFDNISIATAKAIINYLKEMEANYERQLHI